MLDGRADVWMNSRPVSNTEIARATAFGRLDRPAQEHERMDVATEDYALSRRLYLYAGDVQSERVRKFIAFAEGAQGQAIATRLGFVGQQLVAESLPPRTDMPVEYLALTEGALRVSVNFRFDSGLTYLDGKALRDIDRLANFLEGDAMRRHEVAHTICCKPDGQCGTDSPPPFFTDPFGGAPFHDISVGGRRKGASVKTDGSFCISNSNVPGKGSPVNAAHDWEPTGW